MQCYNFELNEKNQDFSNIITSFGKYKCKWLQMSLQFAPAVPWQVMKDVLCDVKNTKVYVGFSPTWKHHLLLTDRILYWLDANSSTVFLLKCEWVIQKLIDLGIDLLQLVFILGAKIDNILQMPHPKINPIYMAFSVLSTIIDSAPKCLYTCSTL